MVNGLIEFRTFIKNHHLSWSDISKVYGNESGFCISTRTFKNLIDQEYYPGYGSQELYRDLVVRFKDGTIMYRHEYDGSEWWEIIKPAPPILKRIRNTKPELYGQRLKDLLQEGEED